ncbi:hypothetical protein [Altererythrobacter sp. GH1-8]|uniref:hypothetical protein n=1 Tax=Altererythrobacter sp. GH1-8 TaxID=3349333 RepID=UPI00374DB8F6
MDSLLQHLRFASDAELMALVGCAIVLVGALAGTMERRRLKRDDLQRVGWVPWLGIFVGCMIIGGGMLALSLPKVLVS